VLQATELALDGHTAPVQVLEPLSVATDAWKQPTAESERRGNLIRLRAPERNDGFAPSFFDSA
jgi:hypothetical protein